MMLISNPEVYVEHLVETNLMRSSSYMVPCGVASITRNDFFTDGELPLTFPSTFFHHYTHYTSMTLNFSVVCVS